MPECTPSVEALVNSRRPPPTPGSSLRIAPSREAASAFISATPNTPAASATETPSNYSSSSRTSNTASFFRLLLTVHPSRTIERAYAVPPSVRAPRRAFENQGVLPELVIEFLDLELAQHVANVCDPRATRPSRPQCDHLIDPRRTLLAAESRSDVCPLPSFTTEHRSRQPKAAVTPGAALASSRFGLVMSIERFPRALMVRGLCDRSSSVWLGCLGSEPTCTACRASRRHSPPPPSAHLDDGDPEVRLLAALRTPSVATRLCQRPPRSLCRQRPWPGVE